MYLKRTLIECGVAWTDVERVCSDRVGLKMCVNERIIHLDKLEMLQGHNYLWEPDESMIVRHEIRLIDRLC